LTTLTLLCRWKSNTAKLQSYPSPSTWSVNSRKKSTIAGAHGGNANKRMNGVNTTLASSVAKSDRLHCEKLAKLHVHGFGVQLIPPLVRKVVRVLDDSLHEHFRVEYPVLFGDHAARNRKDTTEDGKVEEDRAVRSNLEVDEKVRVDDGGEKKDGSKGSSHESCESG
jgi:hypothetical protein